jgi:hypothetical protein
VVEGVCVCDEKRRGSKGVCEMHMGEEEEVKEKEEKEEKLEEERE